MDGGTFVLNSVVPGYSLISVVISDLLGFDVSRLIPTLALCFALFKAVDYVYYSSRRFLLRYCACSVAMASDVDAYYSVQDWLSDKKSFAEKASELMALSTRRPNADQALAFVHPVDPHQGLLGSVKKGRNRRVQEFEPILDSFQYFWHQGRLFVWYRRRERRQFIAPGYDMTTNLIEAKLFCFSQTTKPIKVLMEEAAIHYDGKRAGLTKIRRPAPKKTRNGDGSPWRTVSMRPSRPLNTVILPENVKKNLLADIERYLLPESRQWYAQRGIPYRRGYLFHGAPGTGKTSLSFALAGYLDLNIYCVSLAEQSISEEDLFHLFDQLPERCVVLLEDIDSAGLRKRIIRTGHGIDDADQNDESKDQERHDAAQDVLATQVSLSGLLNVIDGVASHEGRILIMTTNDVTALDKALLRPGRIDVKINFGMATKANAYDLFVQTFVTYTGQSVDEKAKVPEALAAQAKLFSDRIPDERFTPAELQGYLLSWKNSLPQDAVENIEDWINASSCEA